MDADPKDDLTVLGDAVIALHHGSLHFDRAAYRVDCAAELNDASVACALNDTAVVYRDRWVDQITAQRPQPGENAILVRAGEPAISDHVRAQNGREFAGPAHRVSPRISSHHNNRLEAGIPAGQPK